VHDGVVTSAARREFIAEPDGALRLTGRMASDGLDVVCRVDVRLGVDVVAVITIKGSELLRVVHDVVYVARYGPKA